jgi:hypothetical protein
MGPGSQLRLARQSHFSMNTRRALPPRVSKPTNKRCSVHPRRASRCLKPSGLAHETTLIPETDSPQQPRGAPNLPRFRQGAEPLRRHLPEVAAKPARPSQALPAPSTTCEPSKPLSHWPLMCAHARHRKLSSHVTHLLLTDRFRATIYALRPTGRALGARAPLLLGARALRIGRRGRLERRDVHRREWRETPRGDAKRGSGICRDRRRNQTLAPESKEPG